MVCVVPGMVFDPSDVEIVSHYLPKMIATGDVGLGNLSYFFKVSDVYSCKPWLLFSNDKLNPFMKGNQRFVFSFRQKIAQKNRNGKRPRRVLHGESENEGGYWKSSTGEKPILDDHNEGKILGYVNMLNFYEYKTEKKNRKDAAKTTWIMYEYRLPGDVFQEWVICKIKNTFLPEADEYEPVWLRQLFFKDDQTEQTRNIEEHCQSVDLAELGLEDFIWNNDPCQLQLQGSESDEAHVGDDHLDVMELQQGSWENKAEESKETATFDAVDESGINFEAKVYKKSFVNTVLDEVEECLSSDSNMEEFWKDVNHFASLDEVLASFQ